MRKIIRLFLGLVLMFCVAGCGTNSDSNNSSNTTITVIGLNENNYWKYFNVFQSGNIDEEKPTIFYEINGVLDYALYEDVVFVFDVIYYTDGQSDDQYQSYTMRIACNAAGDAAFETTYLGVTNVKIGKWLGADGELVSLVNYNWKIHLNSVSGKVIYSIDSSNYDKLFGKSQDINLQWEGMQALNDNPNNLTIIKLSVCNCIKIV